MNKRLTLVALATVTGLLAFAGNAAAKNDFPYSCKVGGVTVKSQSPCYVSAYGISVPGHDAAKSAKEGNSGSGKKGGGKKGGGFGGPKDLKDKPKGGFGGKGPKDLKS